MKKKKLASHQSPAARNPRGNLRKICVPRLTVAKLQARVCQLDTALLTIGELHAKLHKRMTDDRLALLAALKDAVTFIDRLDKGCAGWTIEDVKRLEAIRLLSLGV